MQIFMIILYAAISVTGLTLVKLGSGNPLSFSVGGTGFSVCIGWVTLLGVVLYIVSFLIYMTLVTKNTLTYLTPVSSAVVYILTTLVSLVVFRENMTPLQWIGWTLILVGVFLMNLHK